MDKKEYKKMVDKISPKENKFKNAIVSFLVGGAIGLIGEIIVVVLMNCFGLGRVESYSWLALILVFFGSLFTALNFFDNWVSFAKAGLFLPTTGFAHSIASSALDYKKDGLITGLGANFFKLAGSVILYGIVSSFIFCLIKVVFNG